MIFRLLNSEDAQRGNAKLVCTKAFDFCGDCIALKIEDRGCQCKMEERLLTITEHIKATFDLRRSLLEHDLNVSDDIFEPSAHEPQARVGIRHIIVSSSHRLPSAPLMALIAASALKASDRLFVAASTVSRVPFDHSIARTSRAATAPVVARICVSASRLAGVYKTE